MANGSPIRPPKTPALNKAGLCLPQPAPVAAVALALGLDETTMRALVREGVVVGYHLRMIDPPELRAALAGIPGIREVRLARGDVWVIRDAIDVERDERIVEVLLDVLDPATEFHTATIDRAGMVPDGQRIV